MAVCLPANVKTVFANFDRHGDLEDVLLTLTAARAMGGHKFSKLDVKRVSFEVHVMSQCNDNHRFISETG